MITQTLKSSNFSRSKATVIDLLDEVRANIEATAEIFKSPEGKIQIFRTVSTLLLQKEAYGQLVDYVDQTISEFEKHKLFSKDTHSTRLLMRIWLILSLFKLYRLKRMETELVTLEKEMKMYGKQNYSTYLFNYYNIKINLNKAQGKLEDAEKDIREALAQKELRNREENTIFLLRSLADHQFNCGRFQDAVGTLARLRATPSYVKTGEEIRLFIELFHLIVHFEAGNHPVVTTAAKEFKSQFRQRLKTEDHVGTRKFFEILTKMNDAAQDGRKFALKTAIKPYLEVAPVFENGDNAIIMHDLYLRARLENRPYYELFLEKIKGNTSE
jgi:tetratricopeptide (TPR) repeat protein